MTERVTYVVAGILRRGEEIVLVRQQGPDDPEEYWALPGGVVEPGETLLEALRREVREEAGLEVRDIGPIAYIAETHTETNGAIIVAGKPLPGRVGIARVIEVLSWEGEIGGLDPDGFVREAAFFALPSAIALLERIRYRVMRQPIVAYLGGEAARGAVWIYCRSSNGQVDLVAGPDTLVE